MKYKMNKLSYSLCLMFFCFSHCFSQTMLEGNVKRENLGYGWIVAVSNNLIYVPASDSVRYPTISQFFKEQNKYGFEIRNQFDPMIDKSVASKWVSIKIMWKNEGEDEMQIIPVMAYYKLNDIEIIGRNQRTYQYQEKDDAITYQIVSSFKFKYITLE